MELYLVCLHEGLALYVSLEECTVHARRTGMTKSIVWHAGKLHLNWNEKMDMFFSNSE
jgi:hypothetical protein